MYMHVHLDVYVTDYFHIPLRGHYPINQPFLGNIIYIYNHIGILLYNLYLTHNSGVVQLGYMKIFHSYGNVDVDVYVIVE